VFAKIVLFAVLISLGDCAADDTAGWIRFNDDDETLSVLVGPDTEADGSSMDRELRSTTGAVVVGTAVVTPASGPVGTQHTVLIDVLDEYEEEVGRATLVTNGDRGEQVHELEQDSADKGLWQIDVRSLGAADEARTDIFTVKLWRAADEGETPDEEVEGG
jgi:hypothetical protein